MKKLLFLLSMLATCGAMQGAGQSLPVAPGTFYFGDAGLSQGLNTVESWKVGRQHDDSPVHVWLNEKGECCAQSWRKFVGYVTDIPTSEVIGQLGNSLENIQIIRDNYKTFGTVGSGYYPVLYKATELAKRCGWSSELTAALTALNK